MNSKMPNFAFNKAKQKPFHHGDDYNLPLTFNLQTLIYKS